MTRSLKYLLLAALGFCISIFVFSATSFAGTAVAGDDSSWLELLRPIYDSFKGGHYMLAGMAALIAAVALLKKYAPAKWGIKAFVNGDAGGALLTLVASFATSMSIQLADAAFSWSMTKTAGYIAIGAAGGYSMIKKLVIEPFIRPLYEKTTGWKHSLLGALLYFFDRPSPTATAEAAGDAAVAAQPPTGVTSPSEIREVE